MSRVKDRFADANRNGYHPREGFFAYSPPLEVEVLP